MRRTEVQLRRSTGTRPRLALCALLAATGALLAAPRESRADDAPPTTGDLQRRHHWYYRNLTALRINPLGLFNEFRFGYRYRTYQALPTILRESYLGVNAVVVASPAWARAGLAVEWQPLAILNLNASYEFAGYFGTFNTVQGYDSQNVNFSDAAQARTNVVNPATMQRNAYATYGTFLTLGGTLQARAGSIVLRSINRAVYSDLSLRAGQKLYYDIYFDVLAPNRGWYFSSDLDLAMIPEGSGFGIGVRATFTHAFYNPAEHGTPVGEAAGNENTLRLGPIFTYNFYEANHSVFNAPTAYVIVNWWAMHRYRAGVPAAGPASQTAPEVSNSPPDPMYPDRDYPSQAIPYVAAGFSFRGDLFLPPGVNRRPQMPAPEPAPTSSPPSS